MRKNALNAKIDPDIANSMMLRRSSLALSILLAGVAASTTTPAHALQVADIANWTSVNEGTATGTIGAATVTLTGVQDGFVLTSSNYTFSEYNPTLPTSPNSIQQRTRTDWSASFSSPVSNLGLYMGNWQGNTSGVSPTTYTFNQTPTLISGCATGTITGNTLTVTNNLDEFDNPTTTFCSGVIQFSGAISTLTLDTNATSFSDQVFTFATFTDSDPGPASVPGPLPLVGAGAAFAWSRRLRSRIQSRSRAS